jgi:hypothetical protein
MIGTIICNIYLSTSPCPRKKERKKKKNEPLGAEAPPLVEGGGPRRGGGSSGRQREYVGVKLRPNPIMICPIKGGGEPGKKTEIDMFKA